LVKHARFEEAKAGLRALVVVVVMVIVTAAVLIAVVVVVVVVNFRGDEISRSNILSYDVMKCGRRVPASF
jgi:hypothetical protein